MSFHLDVWSVLWPVLAVAAGVGLLAVLALVLLDERRLGATEAEAGRRTLTSCPPPSPAPSTAGSPRSASTARTSSTR